MWGCFSIPTFFIYSNFIKLSYRGVYSKQIFAIRYSPESAAIDINVYNKEGKIFFTVTDHDKGIDEKYLPRLFDRYYKVPGTHLLDLPSRKLNKQGYKTAYLDSLTETLPRYYRDLIKTLSRCYSWYHPYTTRGLPEHTTYMTHLLTSIFFFHVGY
jgi:hypothetical protein